MPEYKKQPANAQAFRKGVLKPNQGKRGPNKVTVAAKIIIEAVANALGGAEGLEKWVRKCAENERLFWVSIYPKLLPLQVKTIGNGPRLSSVTIVAAEDITE